MRRFARKIAWILLTALLMGVLGCGKREEPGDPSSVMNMYDVQAQQPSAAAPVEETPASAPQDAPSDAPAPTDAPPEAAPVQQQGTAAQVLSAVGYAFHGTLYAACAYQNVGQTPLTLTGASFRIQTPSGTKNESFTPIAAEHDVLMPGETGYCTLWVPAEGLQAGAAVTVTADVTAVAAESERVPLYVSEQMLIQNYPGFATLSGKLKNAGSDVCELNVVYAGFYDDTGAFLGAWHFTRAVTLNPGDSKAFVSHMRALPIPGIADNAAEIRFAAFGL